MRSILRWICFAPCEALLNLTLAFGGEQESLPTDCASR